MEQNHNAFSSADVHRGDRLKQIDLNCTNILITDNRQQFCTIAIDAADYFRKLKTKECSGGNVWSHIPPCSTKKQEKDLSEGPLKKVDQFINVE